MKVGEFARRARASRLSKKAKFEAAFERARRDLRLLDAAPALSLSPIMGFAERRKAERPILSIARPDQTPRQKEA